MTTLKKSTLMEIINDTLDIYNTDSNINVVKKIKTETVEELGKTVIYITGEHENRHRFGKGAGYWKTQKYTAGYIYIVDTHELLDNHWQPIA